MTLVAGVFVDIEDAILDVGSAKKQSVGFEYQESRGLNVLIATASTAITTSDHRATAPERIDILGQK